MLFDLDGTLLDLGPLHFRALNEALEEFGHSPISLEDHRTRFDGLPTMKKLEMLGIGEETEIESAKQRNTMRLLRETSLRDDRLLGELDKIDKDVFIGVVSNARLETCIPVLLRSGIGRYVKLLIAGPYAHPKPDPEPYQKAITAAYLDVDRTIAVEDNQYGADSAERAGLRCLRVKGPHDITHQFVMEGLYANSVW